MSDIELQAPIRAWKFIIRSGAENARVIDTLPNGGVVSVDARMAVVLAHDEEEARAVAARFADEFGLDPRWLRVADIKVIEITSPKCLCWTEQ